MTVREGPERAGGGAGIRLLWKTGLYRKSPLKRTRTSEGKIEENSEILAWSETKTR